MTNGAKVYVCGLESDPIAEVEKELNELGKSGGGCAVGYVFLPLFLYNSPISDYLNYLLDIKKSVSKFHISILTNP